MATLLDVVLAFSTWIKVGWVVWMAWGAWQIAWYRQGHLEGTLTLPRRFNIIDSRAAEPAGPRAIPVQEPIGHRVLTPEPIVHRFVTPDPFDEVPAHVADAAANSPSPVGMGAPHS
jgi:hypothetical protein